MGILADVTQLQHIGQYGNGTTLAVARLLGLRQGFERRLHGGGAGVIGVVDKGNIADVDDFLATACEAGRCQRLGAGFEVHAVAGSAGDSGKSIINIMLADELQAHLNAPACSLFCAYKGGAHSRGCDFAAAIIAVFAQTKVNNLRFGFGGSLQHVLIVTIEYSKAIRRQVHYDFTLGLANIFHAAQKLHVGFAYIGDKTAVRLRNLAQLGNLPQATHAHFHHCNIRIRLNGKQGFGQANFIIKITLGFHNLIFGTQASGQQILGRSLAIGACNGENLKPLVLQTIGMSQFLISL